MSKSKSVQSVSGEKESVAEFSTLATEQAALLPKWKRNAVRRDHTEGHSVDELSKMWGIPPEVVRVVLAKKGKK